MIIETMTNTGILWQIHRHREHFEAAIQKRKAIGYCIKILVVIGIGIVCWYFRPVPSFDKGGAVSQTQQGDRR